MNPGYHIDCRHSAGNLHLRLWGEFNGLCAWELFKILIRNSGPGRIFISTCGLKCIAGEGVALFRSHMTRRPIPTDWLYFKGKKGFDIAPDGSRVLICSKRDKSLKDKPRPTKRPLLIAKNRNRL